MKTTDTKPGTIHLSEPLNIPQREFDPARDVDRTIDLFRRHTTIGDPVLNSVEGPPWWEASMTRVRQRRQQSQGKKRSR